MNFNTRDENVLFALFTEKFIKLFQMWRAIILPEHVTFIV